MHCLKCTYKVGLQACKGGLFAERAVQIQGEGQTCINAHWRGGHALTEPAVLASPDTRRDHEVQKGKSPEGCGTTR